MSCDAKAIVAEPLLETLRHSRGSGYFLLEGHLRRLHASAVALKRITPPTDELKQVLEAAAAGWPAEEASRVRLLLEPDGEVRVERVALPGGTLEHPATSLELRPPELRVVIDSEAISSGDLRLRHKSTARGVYDEARLRACVGRGGVFDVLLHNEREEITESSIANVAVQQPDGTWHTPPLNCGLLAGVMRAELLRKHGSVLLERVVTLRALQSAVREGRAVALFNSVRGTFRVEVELVPTAAATVAEEPPPVTPLDAPPMSVLVREVLPAPLLRDVRHAVELYLDAEDAGEAEEEDDCEELGEAGKATDDAKAPVTLTRTHWVPLRAGGVSDSGSRGGGGHGGVGELAAPAQHAIEAVVGAVSALPQVRAAIERLSGVVACGGSGVCGVEWWVQGQWGDDKPKELLR